MSVCEMEKAGASCDLAAGQEKTGPEAVEPIVAPDVSTAKPKLNAEQSRLVETHWKWAKRVVREHVAYYEHLYLSSLDWEGAAAVGLCEAAHSFDASRDTDFKAFASHRLFYAVIDLIRAEAPKGYRRGQNGKPPKIASMDRSMPLLQACRIMGASPRGDQKLIHSLFTFHSLLPSADVPVGAGLQSAESFDQALRQLPATYREVVLLLYRHDQSMTEIAGRLGCSLSRVSQRHSQAIEWLREALAA